MCNTAIKEMKEQRTEARECPRYERRGYTTMKEKRGISFVACLFFVVSLVAATTLFIAAAVMWLAEMLSSTALSCLIVGGAAIIVALIFYFASVRRSTRALDDCIDTVCETSSMIKSGYERVRGWVSLIFG